MTQNHNSLATLNGNSDCSDTYLVPLSKIFTYLILKLYKVWITISIYKWGNWGSYTIRNSLHPHPFIHSGTQSSIKWLLIVYHVFNTEQSMENTAASEQNSKTWEKANNNHPQPLPPQLLSVMIKAYSKL
jgi:hypothetical protein